VSLVIKMIWANGFFNGMKISLLFMQKIGRRIFHARLIPLVTYVTGDEPDLFAKLEQERRKKLVCSNHKIP